MCQNLIIKMQKSLLISLSLTILPISLTYLTKHIYKRLLEKQVKQDSYFYNFIFITFRNRICAMHINKSQECGQNCSYHYLQKCIQAIKSAKKTLTICIYHLTLVEISNAIIEAKQRGVKIRCISDYVMTSCSGSRWSKIKNAGVPIKIQSNNAKHNLVHHKFIIVDEDDPNLCRLMFGSVNYTLQGFVNNWDHIIDTNNKEILKRYKEEFDDLWDNFQFF